MYVTALLLRTASGGEAVNAWAHVHGLDGPPSDDRGRPDLTRVAETEPGRVVSQNLEVEPGGNTVLAYLDVAGPDAATAVETNAAFVTLRAAMHTSPGPWTAFAGRLGVRFGATFGVLDTRQESAVFDRLASAIRRLVPVPACGPDQDGAPYIIWLRALPGAMELSLPPATRTRVRRAAVASARLLVANDVASGFPGGSRAAIEEAGAALLAGVLHDEIAVRGLRFVDPENGAEVLFVPGAHVGVAESPVPGTQLVYRAGNAGVDLTIHRRAWEELAAAAGLVKWVVWGIVTDPDRVLALPAAQVPGLVLPTIDSGLRKPASWWGESRSTRLTGGSWTQPFRAEELGAFVVPLSEFLRRLDAPMRVLEFGRGAPKWSELSPRELGDGLRRRRGPRKTVGSGKRP